MKISKNFIIILIVFISVLAGCARQNNTDSVPQATGATNRLENLTGEEFLISLVNCDDAYISREFESYPNHKGVDIAAPEGRQIYAAEDGIVSRVAEMNMGYGYHCIIDHDGYRTLYAHCSRLLVTEGDSVRQGDIIALVGNTGNSTGAHLHFEVIDSKTKEKVNPADFF